MGAIENISKLGNKLPELSRAELNTNDANVLFKKAESMSFSDTGINIIIPILLSKEIEVRERKFDMQVFLTLEIQGNETNVGIVPIKTLKRTMFEVDPTGARPTIKTPILSNLDNKTLMYSSIAEIAVKFPVVKFTTKRKVVQQDFYTDIQGNVKPCILYKGQTEDMYRAKPEEVPQGAEWWTQERNFFKAEAPSDSQKKTIKEYYEAFKVEYKDQLNIDAQKQIDELMNQIYK